MLWNTHMTFGLLTTEAYLYATHYQITPQNIVLTGASLAVSMVCATLPDTDQTVSWAGRRFFFISYPLALIHVKHRGLTHSLLFTFLVWYIFTAFHAPSVITAGGVLGYASHWFIDMFNTTGIQLFYPLQKKLKFGTNIGVNTLGEVLARYLVSALVLVVAYFYAQPLLIQTGIMDKIHIIFSSLMKLNK